MWSSLTLFLLISGMCLDENLASAQGGGPSHARPRSRRMVGGILAYDVPWQALLYFGESVVDGGIGGGALISERWVLTAGRNLFPVKAEIKGKEPSIPKVYLGVTNRNSIHPSKEVAVEKVVLHPEFQKTSEWDNNLALIKLKEPVVFGRTMLPIPLPERGQDLAEYEGQEATKGVIAGWGWSSILTFSKLLKYLVVSVADPNACREEYNGKTRMPVVDDHTFCTGPTAFEENACVGDEGGALAVMDPKDKRIYAAGILSFSSCAVEKHSVYMKLSAYTPWINSVMRGDSEELSASRTSAMTGMLPKQ